MVPVKGGLRYAVALRRLVVVAVAGAAVVTSAVLVDHGGVRRAEEPLPTASRPTTSAGRTSPPTTLPTPSTTPPTTGPTRVPAVRIVPDHIPFGAARRAQTEAYDARHYGTATAVLRPQRIVLHFTESDSYGSARALFASNAAALGELPGTCAHYVVDQRGVVRELVPPTLVCRHTIGLNHVAIGIEFVQSSRGHGSRWAVQQILVRPAQVAAGTALVRSLMARYGIPPAGVIGHAMANDDKAFRDLRGWRNDHTDWQAPEVERFRAGLG